MAGLDDVLATLGVGLSLGLGLAVIGSLASATGCGDDCVEVALDCDPLYEPTFANVHENTLVESCAVGSTCHTADARRGGLDLETADAAYAGLVDDGRVVAGDPSCSLLAQRIASEGDDVMPPGAPLADAERCAILQWIDAGAPR
ncbi:MAG: hypothetical protein KC731_26335 [Myxococcales bacterium]|nr:hypothetical protein [Myxococcales bacterium]